MVTFYLVLLFGGTLLAVLRKVSLQRKKECPFKSLSWDIRYLNQRNNPCFACPKCDWGTYEYNVTQKLCDCPEFPREHFHFKCCNCGYKNILRTKDDS
jgi:hypothetical protein